MRFLPVVSSFLRHQATAPHHLSARLALRCLSTPSSGPVPPLTPAEAQRKLLQADAVCFDVDSTVIQDEGIDVLAEFNGAGQAVKEWTQKAMGGQVLFQDALAARLDLIKPSSADVDVCLAKHPIRLTPGIDKVVQLLHARGAAVYLVSGGFRQMINPVADMLKIPRHRIYANNLLFKADGTFSGFDPAELTSRDGGKPAVIQRLKAAHGYKTVIMFGDGATDMQARPPADAFVGFGGVVVRENVKQGSDWFVTDFQQVIDVLQKEKQP